MNISFTREKMQYGIYHLTVLSNILLILIYLFKLSYKKWVFFLYKVVYRMKINHYVRSWSEGNSKYLHTLYTLFPKCFNLP